MCTINLLKIFELEISACFIWTLPNLASVSWFPGAGEMFTVGTRNCRKRLDMVAPGNSKQVFGGVSLQGFFAAGQPCFWLNICTICGLQLS
jgi:hypothetical protein